MKNEKNNAVKTQMAQKNGSGFYHTSGWIEDFPFKTELNFKKLIDYWMNASEGEDRFRSDAGKKIKERLKNAPELLEPIHDLSVLEKHKDLIRCMMTAVFPDAFWEKQTYAATHPFSFESFFYTPKYEKLLKNTETNPAHLNIPAEVFKEKRILGAYKGILIKCYGLDLSINFPIIQTVVDPDTGLNKYFKLNLADEFMDIKVKGKLKKLSKNDITRIKENFTDVKVVQEIIPPDNFEFSGFITINAIDVTAQEILSLMKHDLIEKESLTSLTGFLKMQEKIQSLLQCPDILIGITELPSDTNQLFKFGRKTGNSFVLDERCMSKCSDAKSSIYAKVLETRKMMIVEDLEEMENRSGIEEGILEQGIRNLLVAPLEHNGEIIGIFEAGSPHPGRINAVNSLQLHEIFPLFAISISRSMEELNNRVQAIIKQECTAIHPAVEWRFRNAALNLIENSKDDKYAEMEDIVFNDIYPLYGLSDIRNSSVQRNNAIKRDLIENLNMANEIIHIARSHRELHSLDELGYRVGKQIESINFGLGSGDEIGILNFLKNDIESLFSHIGQFHPEVTDAIDRYNKAIDKELGFIYKKRKAFEDSATRLNDILSNYMDDEQVKAQAMFPHYFEKYKTDGIDHSMYIGQSMVEKREFDMIYLRNLRLWQFMTVCGIVRKAEVFKSSLPMPLEVANLILVQNSPLAIRFRFDEKQFDVDGAYNIRYEIMKKRIDKAEIKGGEERLTQPGKIAIVYSQQSEADEYLEYIDYLYAKEFIAKEVEDLQLEDLQGVQGLKALRVSVDLDEKHLKNSLSKEEIETAVKGMV